MKELQEAIRSQGIGKEGGIVKVDMFLNHRMNTALMVEMGQAFHQAFGEEPVDLILTVESSGIAVALTTAIAFGNVPVVFAKKGKPSTLAGEVYQSQVFSYTRGEACPISVAKAYLPQEAKVLIIDDFLANGEASQGLVDIVRQAGAQVVGIGICVEKGFQAGGARLRSQGFKVVSLATVTGIEDGKPVLAQQEA